MARAEEAPPPRGAHGAQNGTMAGDWCGCGPGGVGQNSPPSDDSHERGDIKDAMLRAVLFDELPCCPPLMGHVVICSPRARV